MGGRDVHFVKVCRIIIAPAEVCCFGYQLRLVGMENSFRWFSCAGGPATAAFTILAELWYRLGD